MAEWRLGRGWTERELEERLARARDLPRNYTAPVEGMSVEAGWNEYFSEAVIGHEEPGPATSGGPFSRGKKALAGYAFSDPRIVVAHFDPQVPLLNRYMLLEARAFRVLHYLGGVVVGAVREESDEQRTVFGFRYETLEGHIERGAEWFLLTKEHATGDLRFRIQAAWKPGQFPNWWSRVGFSLVGGHYQERWHRNAHAAMQHLVRDPKLARVTGRKERLVHSAPDVIFKRIEARNV